MLCCPDCSGNQTVHLSENPQRIKDIIHSVCSDEKQLKMHLLITSGPIVLCGNVLVCIEGRTCQTGWDQLAKSSEGDTDCWTPQVTNSYRYLFFGANVHFSVSWWWWERGSIAVSGMMGNSFQLTLCCKSFYKHKGNETELSDTNIRFVRYALYFHCWLMMSFASWTGYSLLRHGR